MEIFNQVVKYIFENKEWLFSGIGLVMLGLFFPKKGKVVADKNSKVFQAGRDISNNNNNNNNTNTNSNNITNINNINNINGPIRPILESTKKVERHKEKPVDIILLNNISEIINTIIASEKNNHTLKNYLTEGFDSKNRFYNEMEKQLWGQQIPGLIKKHKIGTTPQIRSLGKLKNVIIKNPTNDKDKGISQEFDFKLSVTTYARVQMPDTSLGNSFENCLLKCTGTVSIGINNKIFEIINLSESESNDIEKALKDMYINSNIYINSYKYESS